MSSDVSVNPYEAPQASEDPASVTLPWWTTLNSEWFSLGLGVGVVAGIGTALWQTGLPFQTMWSAIATAVGVGLAVGVSLGVVLWRTMVLWPLRRLTQRVLNNPDEAEHYVDRGTFYLDRVQEIDRAVGDFSAAVALRGSDGRALAERARAYLRAARPENAIEDLSQAIAVSAPSTSAGARSTQGSPERWQLFVSRADAFCDTKEYGPAAEDLSQAIDLLQAAETSRKQQVRPYYQRADLRRMLQDRAGARADLRAAHRLDPLRLGDDRWVTGYMVAFGMLLGILLILSGADPCAFSFP